MAGVEGVGGGGKVAPDATEGQGRKLFSTLVSPSSNAHL
jgi:hypothetical protein